MGRCKWARN